MAEGQGPGPSSPRFPKASPLHMTDQPPLPFEAAVGDDPWTVVKNSVVFLVGHSPDNHDSSDDSFTHMHAICAPIRLRSLASDRRGFGEERRVLVCIGPLEERRLMEIVRAGRAKPFPEIRYSFRVYTPETTPGRLGCGSFSEIFHWHDYTQNSFRFPRAMLKHMLVAAPALPPPAPLPRPPLLGPGPPGPAPPGPAPPGPPPGRRDDGSSSSGDIPGPTGPKVSKFYGPKEYGEWVAEVGNLGLDEGGV